MTSSLATPRVLHSEKPLAALSGWAILCVYLVVLVVGLFFVAFVGMHTSPLVAFGATVGVVIGVISLKGYFILQPNEAAVLTLFGAYKGTVRGDGLLWNNPFCWRRVLSLRARTLNGDKLKVNDKRGNPIEIAVVVIWRVHDTARASFDVDSYDQYVRMQSESSVRHVASAYVYDDGDAGETTLRGGGDVVTAALVAELQERLARAGVDVEEARITHLAYAPEIAQAMLRRQQAEAVIAARQKIVIGAVSMVEMALKELSDKQVVRLDEERKAAMVSNLLVVLCGESDAQPVLNTGTLYS